MVGRIYANLAKLMGGKAFAGIISLIYMVLAIHALGVRDYGVLILVHAYTITVGGLIEFPGWHAVVRYGAQATRAGDTDRLVRLLRFAGIVELASGALAFAVAALLAPLIGPRLGWTPTAMAFATPYSLAVLATIRSAPAGYLQLIGRFDLLGAHNLVAPTVRLVGALIAVVAGAGLRGFLIAWLVAALAEWGTMWALGWVMARRRLPGPTLLGSARGVIAENPGIRRFMIAANAAGGRGSELRQVVVRSILIALAVALLLLLVVALFGQSLAVLIGGKDFRAAGTVMVWLVAARIVLLVAPSTSAALVALGRPGLSVTANVICSFGLLPLLPVMIEHYGLSGAGFHALLTSFAVALALGTLAWRASKQVGVPRNVQ